jgi:site-specific DNA-cytosine methylase
MEAVTLFSGGGGFDYGLQDAGHEVINALMARLSAGI